MCHVVAALLCESIQRKDMLNRKAISSTRTPIYLILQKIMIDTRKGVHARFTKARSTQGVTDV